MPKEEELGTDSEIDSVNENGSKLHDSPTVNQSGKWCPCVLTQVTRT